MRILLIFSCLYILLILPMNASAMALFEKGVKGGVMVSTIAGDDVDEASNKLGFGGGAWVNFSVINDIGLQTELLYSMKGSKSDNELGESTFSLDYIELPVLATFSLPMASPWTPKLMAGPYLGMNMRSNAAMAGDDVTSDVDMKDETSSLDYGLTFGAGLEVQRFSVDARYAMGLASTSDPTEGEAQDVKNRSFSLLFGLSF